MSKMSDLTKERLGAFTSFDPGAHAGSGLCCTVVILMEVFPLLHLLPQQVLKMHAADRRIVATTWNNFVILFG